MEQRPSVHFMLGNRPRLCHKFHLIFSSHCFDSCLLERAVNLHNYTRVNIRNSSRTGFHLAMTKKSSKAWKQACKQCNLYYYFFFFFSSMTGAEIRSVCTEAGMFAIRARRKMATEKDFLDAVSKVIKAYAKFSATPRYMTYN